jgi:protein TonB
VEVPRDIAPEAEAEGFDEGFAGGVEGGVPGGVAAGIVGGLPADVPAPPPPPPVAAPRGPVRIGGELKAPALLQRVEPVYPAMAMSANIQGTVILEATVDEEGQVQDLRVISGPPLLQKAAVTAVRQWRYSPVLLNGRPASFILTVVLSFNLQQK